VSAQKTKNKPVILIVDDESGDTGLKTVLEGNGSARVSVRHPNDIEEGDIKRADLILVDFQLDNWAERDNLTALSLKPVDGLALAGVLRRQCSDDNPAAIAIHTGKIKELAGPLPPEYRQHALARLNNLEWVFEKARSSEREDRAEEILSLASAVVALPKSWELSGDRLRAQLLGLLGVAKEDEDYQELLKDVEVCVPPIHEISQWSHGLAVLRWFLHRVLPYPCFLWDEHSLAARLQVHASSLEAALQPGKPLRKALGPAEYQGILKTFLGPRWWRSKVERFLWDKTKGTSSDARAVQSAVKKIARNVEAWTADNVSVVCLDQHYRPITLPVAIDKAVRIQPDDWPSYADQAWTTIALANAHSKLRALVVRDDQSKL
jgi:hypothetical protein